MEAHPTTTQTSSDPHQTLLQQALLQRGLQTLEATSRTFYIPISRLPPGLLEAVGSAYLCLRAIDEIEDHPTLDCPSKERLLRDLSRALQASVESFDGQALLMHTSPYREKLAQVTLQVADWLALAPASIAPRIWDATAAMADRMADWAACNWRVRTEADLDRYTFSVAGTVGLMLSDLWGWFDGTLTDRVQAIGFGRGLQAVNILRNRADDLRRGVDFVPDGWEAGFPGRMHDYARRNLSYADAYLASLPEGPARQFCRIPLILAHATLEALAQGRSRLERSEVLRLIEPAPAGQSTT